ncbi:MAG: DUF2484 family protein [Paracoccaceae bacterium]
MSATLALIAALVWLILANVVGMLPSKDQHWSNAYKLIAVGLPILVWLGLTNGALYALVFLVAAGSVLRWPLVYLWRWIRRRLV